MGKGLSRKDTGMGLLDRWRQPRTAHVYALLSTLTPVPPDLVTDGILSLCTRKTSVAQILLSSEVYQLCLIHIEKHSHTPGSGWGFTLGLFLFLFYERGLTVELWLPQNS